MTMTESNCACIASAAVFSSTNWCASQAMVLLLPLPAECWIR
jgi:hypothetical protein